MNTRRYFLHAQICVCFIFVPYFYTSICILLMNYICVIKYFTYFLIVLAFPYTILPKPNPATSKYTLQSEKRVFFCFGQCMSKDITSVRMGSYISIRIINFIDGHVCMFYCKKTSSSASTGFVLDEKRDFILGNRILSSYTTTFGNEIYEVTRDN